MFIGIDIYWPTAKANFEFWRESELACSNIATDSNRTLVYIFYPMELKFLVELSSKFVTTLFADELSLQLSFHSAHHTGNVVIAAQEIGVKVGLSPEELDLVTIAAWFHDTGYTKGYAGHEQLSVNIARDFLADNGLDALYIEQVTSCILATTYPQSPKNILEMVLCDADFYHFSRANYPTFEASLRREWETCLNIHYTTEQWNALNLAMLTNHEYFTVYGKTVLQARKQKNIDNLKNTLNHSL
ncbi:HD domain-containing protein [Pedobacter cryotolerans]|uniref:HD domain-containing protein n=1 Tax=Pedobacter cryotolerans TaxID=2571270 RepID=A0A4U1C0D4_9SPHI|nr:HD domain-containing protein [Pedobacter cryotolerans]